MATGQLQQCLRPRGQEIERPVPEQVVPHYIHIGAERGERVGEPTCLRALPGPVYARERDEETRTEAWQSGGAESPQVAGNWWGPYRCCSVCEQIERARCLPRGSDLACILPCLWILGEYPLKPCT